MDQNLHDSILHYKDPTIAQAFHEDRYGGKIGHWFMETEQNTYAYLAALLPPVKTVLDIGTGSGKLHACIPSPRFIGLDTSLPMLKKARELSDLRFLLSADCTRLPVKNKSFDLVVGSRLLMHIPSWQLLIRECCRVSKCGVILDFPVHPSFAAIEPRIWKMSRGRDSHPIHRVFHKQEIIESFSENGFECAALVKGFVLPYRFHRVLNSLAASKRIEGITRKTGMTKVFGSPAYGLFVPADQRGIQVNKPSISAASGIMGQESAR